MSLNTRIHNPHTHTHVQTGTEQYRGDPLRFSAPGSMRRFPASVHTKTIYSRSWLVLLKASLFFFGPTVRLEYRTADPTMHCRSNSRENTDLRSFHDNWQSWERDREVRGSGRRSGRHHDRKWNVKKRRVTLWSTRCDFWFLSHVVVFCFFVFFFSFRHRFVCFHVRCAHLDKVKTHAETRRRGGRSSCVETRTPGGDDAGSSSAARWDWSAFQCLSAALRSVRRSTAIAGWLSTSASAGEDLGGTEAALNLWRVRTAVGHVVISHTSAVHRRWVRQTEATRFSSTDFSHDTRLCSLRSFSYSIAFIIIDFKSEKSTGGAMEVTKCTKHKLMKNKSSKI